MSAAQDHIREQLIEARRNQILDATAKVFAEKGFHRATTKEIARAAGVSEGTIYNYFASKADLVVGIMTRLAELDALGEELAGALQSEPREFFIAAFRHRVNRIRQGQEMLQAILPEVLTSPELRESFYRQYVLRIAEMLEQYVRTRVELGDIRPVNVPLTVRALQSIFVGLFVMRILGDEAVLSGWDDVPEVLATLIFDGLCPRPEEVAG
ncbi:MAG: hypothetical protein DRI79_07665 [Chloroflexi bacterium]|nr:MAG: hypothetical protein DRI80_14610 [Chloroflexota bacterium]RLC88537.1 MAG: hypothetical protein DRI79_07665 [Chloroflexota bacterium]